MNNWIRSICDKADALVPTRRRWFDSPEPLYIYGTGGMARDIARVLRVKGFEILAFVDHLGTSGATCEGLPVVRPDAIQESRANPIVMGIHNYKADLPSLILRLQSLGFTHIVSNVDLYDCVGAELGDRYWLGSRSFYKAQIENIVALDAFWSDDASRLLYKQVLEYRMTGDSLVLPNPATSTQYHPSDIPAWEYPLRMVDCGAFTGDTVLDFINHKLAIASFSAFEPDSANFTQLAKNVRLNQQHLPDAKLWPCGVSRTTGLVSFDAAQGLGSHISSAGTSAIQCVSLDEALQNADINLIKMDIEGAEPDALLGARELIKDRRPGLALSVYHTPAHLWEIPFLVKTLIQGDARYYLRMHGHSTFDLVLYVLPC